MGTGKKRRRWIFSGVTFFLDCTGDGLRLKNS